MSGRDLTGRPVRMPADLPAVPALAVFGFTFSHQRDIDAWAAAVPDHPLLEVVLLERWQRLRRHWIEGGMALGIPDRDVRARTWCLYTDLAVPLGAFGLDDGSAVIAAVVDPDGRVRTWCTGPPVPTTAAALRTALSQPAVPPVRGDRS